MLRKFLFYCLVSILTVCPAIDSLQAEAGKKSQNDRRQIKKESRRLLRIARDQFESGQYDSVLIFTDSILTLDSGNADGYFYQGRAYLHLNDSLKAVASLESGVDNAPKSSRNKILLGNIFYNQGKIIQSDKLVDAVLLINPRHTAALYLKGKLLINQGDSTNGISTLEKACEIELSKRKD